MIKFPQLLNSIIENSGLNLHNINQASGISNTYLAKLTKGLINRPGKNKIASILLALNYSISGINEVLLSYNYQPLHQHDITGILKNNSGRKIEGGNLPQYDHIYFDLFLVALERLGGVKMLVKNRPSGAFMPLELYMTKEFPHEENDAATIFRYHLTEALVKERSQLFLQNCKSGNRVVAYICTCCFNEYLGRHIGEDARRQNPRKAQLVSQYIANALSLSLKHPQLHQMYIMERCPYFHFQIQDSEGKSPKVSYTGRKMHQFNNQYDKKIVEGFTTDLAHMVGLFKQELTMCHEALLPGMDSNYSKFINNYIQDQFSHHGMAEELNHYLDSLMQNTAIHFY